MLKKFLLVVFVFAALPFLFLFSSREVFSQGTEKELTEFEKIFQ